MTKNILKLKKYYSVHKSIQRYN